MIPGNYPLNRMLNLAWTQIHAVDMFGMLSVQKGEKSVPEILVANFIVNAKITHQVQENFHKCWSGSSLVVQIYTGNMIQRKYDLYSKKKKKGNVIWEKASGCHHFCIHKLGFSEKP